MYSDKFECDAAGCSGRATWLVWLSQHPDKKFFACEHDVDAMRKAVGLLNTQLKIGEIVTRRIDEVLTTDPRLNQKPQA